MESTTTTATTTTATEKPPTAKRGSKAATTTATAAADEGAAAVAAVKKRGRKPKGGKIVSGEEVDKPVVETCPSVILHLKCSMKEVYDHIEEIKNMGATTTHLVGGGGGNTKLSSAGTPPETDVLDYLDICGGHGSQLADISNNPSSHILLTEPAAAAAAACDETSMSLSDSAPAPTATASSHQYNANLESFLPITATATATATSSSSREAAAPTPNLTHIQQKLKQLEHKLHLNQTGNKPSACFWDTCFFEGPPVYIPMYQTGGTYHVYGNFCCPRCAVAYLHAEHIDSSTKFERYALLQQMYGSIYEYKKPIQPAPSPHVLLDKFVGNLTIGEYRALMQTDKLYLTVNKPMTRVLPELVESHEDHILNTKIIPSSAQMLKFGGSGAGGVNGTTTVRKNQKAAILNAKFGIVTAPEATA